MKPQVAAHDRWDEGPQDRSGWGLLGLLVGVLSGFALTFYVILPMLPKDKGTLMITLMTTIITAGMTIGGAVGYMVARRKQAA